MQITEAPRPIATEVLAKPETEPEEGLSALFGHVPWHLVKSL